MFSEIWRWVEVSKYKVLKSLKGLSEGRCLNPTPPPQKTFHGREMDNSCNERQHRTLKHRTQNNESNFQTIILFHSQYFNFTCTRNL